MTIEIKVGAFLPFFATLVLLVIGPVRGHPNGGAGGGLDPDSVYCYDCADTESAFVNQSAASCGKYGPVRGPCSACIFYRGKIVSPYKMPKKLFELVYQGLERDNAFPATKPNMVVRACYAFDYFIEPQSPLSQAIRNNRYFNLKMLYQRNPRAVAMALGFDYNGQLEFCFKNRCNPKIYDPLDFGRKNVFLKDKQ